MKSHTHLYSVITNWARQSEYIFLMVNNHVTPFFPSFLAHHHHLKSNRRSFNVIIRGILVVLHFIWNIT